MISGAFVSSIVNVAVVVLSLPHASVAVNVTVAEPVAPQRSNSAVKSLLQVTGPQASSAVAPPLLSNQAFSSSSLPLPSHSTVEATAGAMMRGGVVSEPRSPAGSMWCCHRHPLRSRYGLWCSCLGSGRYLVRIRDLRRGSQLSLTVAWPVALGVYVVPLSVTLAISITEPRPITARAHDEVDRHYQIVRVDPVRGELQLG